MSKRRHLASDPADDEPPSKKRRQLREKERSKSASNLSRASKSPKTTAPKACGVPYIYVQAGKRQAPYQVRTASHHSVPGSTRVAQSIDNIIEIIKIEWKEYIGGDGKTMKQKWQEQISQVQSKNIDSYLSDYATEYFPDDSAASRRWQERAKELINKCNTILQNIPEMDNLVINDNNNDSNNNNNNNSNDNSNSQVSDSNDNNVNNSIDNNEINMSDIANGDVINGD